MPLSKVERDLAAFFVVVIVDAGWIEEVEEAEEGRIGDVVVMGGASVAVPRSPRWRFTFTMSNGLPIMIPAAPET